MRFHSILARTSTLAAAWCVSFNALTAELPPQISWASDPVRPDEAVLVVGDGFSPDSKIAISTLGDGVRQTIQPLDISTRSLKFVIPKAWPQGAWQVQIQNAHAISKPVFLNQPAVWWKNCDAGDTATPGGWVRVFGKSLNFGGRSQGVLRDPTGKDVPLVLSQGNAYALDFAVPKDLAPGVYTMSVHNGLGGNANWKEAGNITIARPPAWKTDLINLKDFISSSTNALIDALKKAEKNGGGIVYLPRGRYAVQDTLRVPANTIVRGEAMELVSLYWPDYVKPPTDLICGTNYGLESLTIYCQNHRNVINTSDDTRRFTMRQVRIRANCYFMIEKIGKEFRGRNGPASHNECGAAVWLKGRNFEVVDSDIYASGFGVLVSGGENGVIARNAISSGFRCYRIENAASLIVESNLIAGNNLLTIGNDVGTFRNEYPNRCSHIYYSQNRMQKFFGADREIMTLDATSGAYFGTLASAEGLKVVLANDPVYRDYATLQNRPARTNWVGAILQVLGGKGEGQYRFVTAHSGRHWNIDRPWDIQPDTKSLVGIVPFRGQSLFIGNSVADGGPFQLYGTAHECIVAENKGARMGGPMGDGFTVWGLNGRGWGHQVSWFCQFLDNEITEGNGYGPRTAGFGTIAHDKSNTFAGPMVRGALFRRNICRNNSGINISGPTADVIVEHSKIQNTEVGISIGSASERLLLRENTFENVARPEVRPR